MKIKLAEALLRRKELQDKIKTLEPLNKQEIFELKIKRINVAEGIDEVTAGVPKYKFTDFTHCYDWHCKQLRLVDAAIQQANWTCELDVNDTVMEDYIPISQE